MSLFSIAEKSWGRDGGAKSWREEVKILFIHGNRVWDYSNLAHIQARAENINVVFKITFSTRDAGWNDLLYDARSIFSSQQNIAMNGTTEKGANFFRFAGWALIYDHLWISYFCANSLGSSRRSHPPRHHQEIITRELCWREKILMFFLFFSWLVDWWWYYDFVNCAWKSDQSIHAKKKHKDEIQDVLRRRRKREREAEK